jgi:hypothetical protein
MMAKVSGLGDNFYVGGVDLSGDICALKTIRGGIATIEATDITQSAIERLGGKTDGQVQFTSLFDPATGKAHPTLKTLPTADIMVTYARGTTLGSDAAAMVAKQLNYDGTRDDKGDFRFEVEAAANGFGLEWGIQLTAGIRSDTTATSPATGVDFTTVSTAFGWQAYLQAFSFTGTSCTVTIQDSADNSAFTTITGGAFTAITAATTQRLVGGATATVRRFLRVITTGTFSQCSFNVVFMRNTVASPSF